jgi:hypothetical protein
MKYHGLIVFIRHDSADIWGFMYELTPGIGSLRNMASTGAFMRVVCALKISINIFSQTSSMILTHLKHWKSHSLQKMGPERELYEVRQRTEETERQPRIVVNLIKLNT